jgi:hypothetical protein
MRFKVVCCRHHGASRPRQDVLADPGYVGDLEVVQAPHVISKRLCTVAVLRPSDGLPLGKPFPDLYQVELVAMSPQAFTLVGTEVIATADGVTREFAQVWWLRLP